MKPIETLARAPTPEGGELVLWRRDGVYHLSADGMALMTSRAHGSEEALARLAWEALPASRRIAPRVLVGGLGFGYTLRAALDLVPPSAKVVVCEVFAAVLEWNRGILADLARRPLRDRRVEARQLDVWTALADPEPFDMILLDVDNGPRAFTLRANQRLYERAGLERLRRGLQPKGVLAVWSSSPSAQFEAQLAAAGFGVTVERVPAHERMQGARHVVFLATPRSGRPREDRPGQSDRAGRRERDGAAKPRR